MSDRSILKWTIPVDDEDHRIGSGPVVHVGEQYGAVCVWTDETGEPTMTTARVYGTGHPILGSGDAVGTVIALGGALVLHVVRDSL